MATLVIRHVDDSLHARLKKQAAAHGRSMEEEVRQLLHGALDVQDRVAQVGLGTAIRALFEPLGGLELPEIERDLPREPPDFSGPEYDREQ